MEKRIKIEEGSITFCAYGDISFNAAELTINGEQKYFCADNPKQLMDKIAKYIMDI